MAYRYDVVVRLGWSIVFVFCDWPVVKLRAFVIDGLYLRDDDRVLLGVVERTVDVDDYDGDINLK